MLYPSPLFTNTSRYPPSNVPVPVVTRIHLVMAVGAELGKFVGSDVGGLLGEFVGLRVGGLLGALVDSDDTGAGEEGLGKLVG